MNINIPNENIKGIVLVSVFVSFMIDSIIIEDFSKIIFESFNSDILQHFNNIPIETINSKKCHIKNTTEVIKPVSISNTNIVNEINNETDTDDDKSFIVDDIQSLESSYLNNGNKTESNYPESFSGNITRTKKLQPYPKTEVKKQETSMPNRF